MSKSNKGFYFVKANSEVLLNSCECSDTLLLLVAGYVNELNETGSVNGTMVMPSETDENGEPMFSIGFQRYESNY